jgi:hypothetical protein
MKIARLFLSLMLLTSVVACSSDQEKADEAKEQAMNEKKEADAKAAAQTYKPKLICPQVAIVRTLGTVRDFGNEKPEPAQLVAAARMESLAGNCGYQDTGIDIAFTLTFKAAKGPRLGGNKADFPFFVAVVDPSGAILNKDQMTEEFKFKSDEKIADTSEDLHVFIPLPKDKSSTGPDYRVLAGFQLTEDQLKEVRAAENKGTAKPN